MWATVVIVTLASWVIIFPLIISFEYKNIHGNLCGYRLGFQDKLKDINSHFYFKKLFSAQLLYNLL